MSQEERDELTWLKRVKDGNISQREAAERIGLSERWVRKRPQRLLEVHSWAAAKPFATPIAG